MKRITFPLLVILVLATIVAASSTSAAIVPEHGSSAFGAGQFRYRNPRTERLETWSFNFEALSNKNGQTRGRAEFDNLTAQTQVVVRINCLSLSPVLNTEVVIIGGRVMHSDDPDLPKLENVIFAASDGPLFFFPGDNISPLFPLAPFEGVEDCHDTQPLTILPVEGGDIQIQP